MPSARRVGGTRRLLALAAALSVLISVLLVTRAGAAPDKPRPTLATVIKSLDKLAQEAEILTEKYNAAHLKVQRLQQDAARAQRAAAAAARRYSAARVPFNSVAVAQYEGAPASNVGALLSSADQQAYLQSLATRHMVATRLAELVAQVQQAEVAADRASKNARAALRKAKKASDALADQGEQVHKRTVKYRALLATLTDADQHAYGSRNAPSPREVQAALAERAPNAAAQRAVDFALAQLGKPYVWAAAGPNAFDCSGLTMAAWARSGVVLPHLSQAQFLLGRHVSYGQLRPGDLVFLYGDVHHVELYIGNGLAVSAPQEGEPVKIVKVPDDGDFAGAVRLW